MQINRRKNESFFKNLAKIEKTQINTPLDYDNDYSSKIRRLILLEKLGR